MDKKTYYIWKASCNDGSWCDKSKTKFASKQECYDDMRNAALEKMKWNTEYEDAFDNDDETSINYSVHFMRNSIVHNSYSGVYTYEIVEAYEESAPRFIIDSHIIASSKEDITLIENEMITSIVNVLRKIKSKYSQIEVAQISGYEHLII